MTKRKPAPNWGQHGGKHPSQNSPPALKPKKKKKEPMPYTMISAADVEPKDVHWLWHPYIPAGKVTIIEGDPGLGKSWMAYKLAADVSCGRGLPGQSHAMPPQRALLISAEDDVEDTIVPRLMSMGANLQNISIMVEEGPVFDKEGRDRLEVTLKNFAAGIVFIDPIIAYMGAKVDMNKANEVREIMAGLKTLAEHTGTAIVVVRHLRKAKSGGAIHQGLGSIDFTAAARSVLMVMRNGAGEPIVAHTKCNVGRKGRCLTYELDAEHGLVWGDFTDDDPEDIVSGRKARKDDSEATKLALARQLVWEALQAGPKPSTEIFEMCAKHNIAKRTASRAKKGLVRSDKHGDDGRWWWSLIEGAEPPGEDIGSS